MTMQSAPYYDDIVSGDPQGTAHWITAADGVRLRVGHWTPKSAPNGTVIMFPGRAEYVEKYHHAAVEFANRGFASAAIDWRGQGIADRLTAVRGTGHVGQFSDYQLDVTAFVDHARALGLPEPYYLIGHSMGGCIGLRALHLDLPVQAAAFSAPMWGVLIAPHLRPIAWGLGSIAGRVGIGHLFAPGQGETTYVLDAPFEDNTLTTDPKMFEMLREQLIAHPELALGGPSMHWVGMSLIEMRTLAKMPSPNMPCLTFLGGNERIVDPARIKSRMAKWPNGTLKILNGAEHEVMMETPEMATAAFDDMAAHFKAHT